MTTRQKILQVYPKVHSYKLNGCYERINFCVSVNGLRVSYGETRAEAWKKALVWYKAAIQKRFLRKLES
jgi:hypothetical protein